MERGNNVREGRFLRSSLSSRWSGSCGKSHEFLTPQGQNLSWDDVLSWPQGELLIAPRKSMRIWTYEGTIFMQPLSRYTDSYKGAPSMVLLKPHRIKCPVLWGPLRCRGSPFSALSLSRLSVALCFGFCPFLRRLLPLPPPMSDCITIRFAVSLQCSKSQKKGFQVRTSPLTGMPHKEIFDQHH